eukprot:CAMPEP_0114576578 /NCGR_PEP_ID=MMETSP0125-20121206/1316_1 /TAXON_ID=485358 ORGANISM="Aristerostoma sp., Strain ATCC 50986" /NCGR_SAMPLE_ID=MMETSP0125 /ASSEMBLY_ACC=CAM_ASM_000245 /LENGTH=121 /DNA_ID=CAMNT_0001765185 /DNA_START=1020 /DNA_END=1385 /DNA_ORIENTATION=-
MDFEESTFGKLLSKGASMIPLFGEAISSKIDFLNEKISILTVKNKASNISQFGVNGTTFDELAMYVSSALILDDRNKEIIDCYTLEKANSGWFGNIMATFNQIKSDMEDKIVKDYKKYQAI